METTGGDNDDLGEKRDPVKEYRKKLVNFGLHQIENEPTEIYGEGFREAQAAVALFGLRQTLDHVQLTGNLPEG